LVKAKENVDHDVISSFWVWGINLIPNSKKEKMKNLNEYDFLTGRRTSFLYSR